MLLSILDQCIDLEWWAEREVMTWLNLVGPGKMVTGAQREPERYRSILKVLNRMDKAMPGSMEIEVFEDEGFRAKLKLRNTQEVGRLRITGPDFDPAFAWPPWDQA